ncbi:MAG: 2Fe-2S iron-sulfur cluster-binding protein [Saprospiraceae bacterium]
MITIHITDREYKTHSILVPVDIDLNLMEIAKANDLPVEGTCGGMALCASCHMYIISDHELKEPSQDEIIMLDQAFFVEENSRLGCQIKVNEKLDGLTVKLAPVAN